MKVYLDQKPHQVPRGDLNIDTDIYRVEYYTDRTVKKRHQILDQEITKINARFSQEIFNTGAKKFEVVSGSVAGNDVDSGRN